MTIFYRKLADVRSDVERRPATTPSLIAPLLPAYYAAPSAAAAD